MIGRLAVRAENASDLAAAQMAQKGFKIEPLFPKTYKKPFAMAARDLYRQRPLPAAPQGKLHSIVVEKRVCVGHTPLCSYLPCHAGQSMHISSSSGHEHHEELDIMQ